MARLYTKGNEIKNFKDWTIWLNEKDKQKYVTVTYYSEKKFIQLLNNWDITPAYNLTEDLLFNKENKIFKQIESALVIGEKYLIVKFKGKDKEYILKYDNFITFTSTNLAQSDIYKYFQSTAKERVELSSADNKKIAENICRQFCKIIAFEDTTLQAYITRKISKRDGLAHYIYPFGINESQGEAVKKAFESQISVIEGPPGTGKTQTILNIVSNIIVNGKTCAIVSNNNPAVENVYEKMEKINLGFFIAKLGSNSNKKEFFDSINYQKPLRCENVDIEEVDSILNNLSRYLKAKNDYAQIVSEIDEILIEKKYLKTWFNDMELTQADTILKIKSSKIVDLLVYLRSLTENKLTFMNKTKLILCYRVFKWDSLKDNNQRLDYIFGLQISFYEKLLQEKNNKKNELEKILKKGCFDSNLNELKEKSLHYLYNYINSVFADELEPFTEKNYKKNFGKFVNAFPIIGSSTHSLLNSIADGYLLDYVIIDEASQQDLVPGILCLACAKNVIIVGDRKQLPHIPTPSRLNCPSEFYDCNKYSLLDSVCELFDNKVPKTLLKEHYRCHPKIIQFCNRQFYDNKLIPMTVDHGEDALSLVTTALGNHMRNNSNLREIDSVIKTNELSGFLSQKVGFIAPYNAQISLAEKELSSEIIKDTIHKFQGRECDEIIFSTVLDKKVRSKIQLDFVDNASLINVAVSRAINKFTLVTGNNVFASNKHIAALIQYIKYYANDSYIFDSPVISAFDLLYNEFDKSLEKLQSKLRKEDSEYKSEQIIAALLREIISQEEFKEIYIHKQVFLKQLVNPKYIGFSQAELEFINSGSSCDFGVYKKKMLIGAIEVDGCYHELPRQQLRDQLKNEILRKAGMKLLRLPTTSSNVEMKITEHLRNCIERGNIKQL